MSFHGVIIPTDGTRDDWLEKRSAGIGASDVAGILGVSPWKSPFEVYAEKMLGVEREPTERMSWGLRLEDVVIEAFTELEGLYVGNRQALVQHPEVEWGLATIDGLLYESSPDFDPDTPANLVVPVHPDVKADLTGPQFSIGNYEGKTDGSWKRWDTLPDHSEIQTQYQLWVTGHDVGKLACLHGGSKLEIYEYERDQGLIDMIVERVAEFRDKHLIDPDSPAPEIDQPIDSKFLADLWDVEPDKQVDLNKSAEADLRALRLVKDELKRLGDEEKRLKARVASVLQDAEVGLVDGRVAVTWKAYERKGYEVKPSSGRSMLVKDFD